MPAAEPTTTASDDTLLARAISISLWAGLLLLGVKIAAAWATGSSGIYSDAAESTVNVLAALFAAYSLRLSRKPADDTHHYGHEKASYLSAGFEGAMISVAACLILHQAIQQLLSKGQVERAGLGMILTLATASANAALGLYLIRTGRKHHSLVVEANGQHVLTDFWTSGGVILGLLLVMATGTWFWDPIAAIIVAANIFWTGWRIVRKSLDGLMDATDPAMEKAIHEFLTRETARLHIGFHQLRHRRSGRTHWVDVHLVFPDDWPLERAHSQATEIEAGLHALLAPSSRIITHLEPVSAAGKSEAWD